MTDMRPKMSSRQSAQDQFWHWVAGGSGCWLWGGPGGKAGGYVVDLGNEIIPVAIYAWRDVNNEELGPGDTLILTCGNSVCCNPFHMVREPGTGVRNKVVARGADTPKVCPNGHPWEDGSYRVASSGQRVCFVCKREKFPGYRISVDLAGGTTHETEAATRNPDRLHGR